MPLLTRHPHQPCPVRQILCGHHFHQQDRDAPAPAPVRPPWEKNSSMPEVYVHLSGGGIERKMLENVGLIDVDEKGPTTLEPVMCPRCRSLNAFDVNNCSRRSDAQNEQASIKVEQFTDEANVSGTKIINSRLFEFFYVVHHIWL